MDGVLERHGQIDLLVNNAGGQFLTPAEDITPKGFRTVIRLNVEGTWLMTHTVATRAMIPDSRGGKIVNVTLSPHHGLPGMAHSSAARAAVENLTRVLSIEWARFGIRLTAVAPGPMATETMMTKYPKPVVEGVAGTVPLQRMGTEEEFAWLVAYIASPGGDYLSGAILTLDGARDNWFGPWPPRGLVGRRGQAALRGEAPEAVSEVPELQTERLLMRGWRVRGLRAVGGDPRRPGGGRGLGKPDGLTPHEAWLDMSVLSAHWALRGFGHWVLEERDSGELVGPRRALLPARLARDGGRLDGGAQALGQGLCARGRTRRVRVGARRAGRAAHRQPDPSRRTRSRSASRRSSARSSRATTARVDSTCVVYGTDLPLIDSPR